MQNNDIWILTHTYIIHFVLCNLSSSGYTMQNQKNDPISGVQNAKINLFNVWYENYWWFLKIKQILNYMLICINSFRSNYIFNTWDISQKRWKYISHQSNAYYYLKSSVYVPSDNLYYCFFKSNCRQFQLAVDRIIVSLTI